MADGNPFHDWLFAAGGSSNGGWGAAAKEGRGIGAMTKLSLLYAEKTRKFGEICALLAGELGYGEWSTLNVQDRVRLVNEAEKYIQEWEETVGMIPTVRPIPPLRRLLSTYHMICERILDEHELEMGLWVQKARKRTRVARTGLRRSVFL
jgi:hypothetical protein